MLFYMRKTLRGNLAGLDRGGLYYAWKEVTGLKRLIALWVCLMAAWGCLTCARADESWSLPEDVWQLIPCGEKALAVANDAVYLLSGAEEGHALLITVDGVKQELPFYLFAGQGKGINALIRRETSWVLCRGTVQDYALILTTVGEMPLPWEQPGVMNLMACEEGVVALYEGDLFCWNPDTGGTMEWHGWGDQPLMAGGGMLLTCHESEGRSAIEVYQVHLGTRTISHLVTADWTQDLSISPDGRTVAWLHQTAVTAWQEGEEESKGYLGVASPAKAHPCAVTDGQRFYLADGSRVLSTQTVPGFDMSDLGLVVGHTGIDLMLNRVRQAHGEMNVVDRELPFGTDPASIAQAIRTGDQSVDIYLIRTSYGGYRAMLEKGFCADLSESEALMSQVLAMPSSIADAVMSEGRLLAIPYAPVFAEGTLGCSAQALEAMGLTLEDVPRTVDGLLDALMVWMEEGRMDQVWVSETHEDASLLYGLTVNGYVLCEGKGQGYIDLRDPAFRALMEKYDQVAKLLERREKPDINAPVLFSMRGLDRFLGISAFGEYVLPWSTHRTANWQMLRYAALPEQEQWIGVALDVAVVNPLSKRKEEAIAFLELMLEELPAQDALCFWPDRAVPVENPAYLKDTGALRREIETYEDILTRDDLTVDERASAENVLDDLLGELAQSEDRRWLVSEEAIETYRSAQGELAVMTSDMMSLIFDAGGLNMMQRYLDGQATVDQLVDTLANLSWSIMQENQ